MFAVRRPTAAFFSINRQCGKQWGKRGEKRALDCFNSLSSFFPTQFNLNMIAICTRNWRKELNLNFNLMMCRHCRVDFHCKTLNSININNAYRSKSTIFDFQFRFVSADRQNRIKCLENFHALCFSARKILSLFILVKSERRLLQV